MTILEAKVAISVGIHRILAELLHSTDLELGNSVDSERILAELPCSSYSEDSQHAEKSFGLQNLASLSTL
jgi:hypothetical protein